MSARSRQAAVVVCAALLAVSGMSATANGQTSATAEPSPSSSAQGVRNTLGKRIPGYWTKRRMRAATPEPIPAVTSATQQTQPSNLLPGRTVEGTLPQRKIARTGARSAPALIGSRAERWYGQGNMPARTIGKIYYRRNDGTPGYCSGSVINAGNRNTVWTSGHCVHAGGGGAANWFSDFIFVPDTDNGQEPQGRWTWRYANTTLGWYNDHNWSYDIAAIAFNPQPLRGNLQDWLGSQGYKFGYGQLYPNVYAFGYPQDGFNRTDFTGNDLWYCTGSTWRTSASDDRMNMSNDMFHGSSGGPWLEDLQVSRGWGYIVGANSHRDVDANGNPTSIVYRSPNHGDGAINVYNDVTAH
ncbi:hypothetical protein ABZ297_33970 [Nonomuraea sp. NPDC005983]|uniref:trypsin-like serine peptidase n=1 Tax=Nonomuraea sp. NPDC005983 TaxID=3155595 RepID=UPI0033A48082